MVWTYIIAWIAMAVISYALAPKPKMDNMKASEFNDIPTAEEGVEIPVLFGTREISNPNVVWFGDKLARAIKKKGGKK